MSVLLQGVGRGREGEPGPVFSSCWIFPGAVSSPHLQENSNKRTKIIQVKLLFCVSQEPFEQAKGREPFSLTQSSLQRGGQHLSSLIGFSAPIFSLSVRTSLELFCTLAHLIWCAPFLLQGEDGGQWGQLEGRVPRLFLFLSLQLLLLFPSARQSIGVFAHRKLPFAQNELLAFVQTN